MNQGEKPKRERPLLAVLLILFAFSLRVLAQGAFQNLDFESANNLPNPPPMQPTLVPITNALPGWKVHEGDPSATQIFYNGVSLGSALVTLVGTNPSGITPALAGNYSVTLDVGEGSAGITSAAISQNGIVPIGTESIRFIANGDVISTSGFLTVTFNGQNVPVTELAAFSTFNSYGADFSAFAGQTGELRFTENPGTRPDSIVYLDSITFSPNPIPEPGAGSLLLCGAGFFGAIRYARSKLNR